MAFQKSFPKRTDKSNYPTWEEVELSDEEEKKVEESARKENIKIMAECIADARRLFKKNDMDKSQNDIIEVAKSLFDKRASHQVYHKEKAAKEKFDKKFK